jgi:hypothetical protein
MKDFFCETLMIPAKDSSVIHFAIDSVKVSDYFTLKGRTLDLVLVDQQKIESEALQNSIKSVLEVDVDTERKESGIFSHSWHLLLLILEFIFFRPLFIP